MKWCVMVLLVGCTGRPSPAPTEDRGGKAFDAKARDVLDAPTRLEILTIDPSVRADGSTAPTDFHDHAVIGRATIDDPAESRRLVDLVYRGVDHSDGKIAACFNPRHGISATKGDHTIDLLICYECLQIQVLPGEDVVLTADDVEPDVNAFFAAHGL